MESFNIQKLKDYIPTELPRLPAWHASMNPDEEDDYHNNPPQDNEQEQPQKSTSLAVAEPQPIDSGPRSYLDLINECDNFPYYQVNRELFFTHVNTYYGLYVAKLPDIELGYVLPSVAQIFKGLPGWKINEGERRLTLVAGNNEEERTKTIALTTTAMRATGHFEVLKGWRDELYPVYGPDGKLLFSVERAASALFGIVTYGCHMTAFSRNSAGDMRIWVPRRAANKQTYGSMLDNTVAGGISTGEKPFESLVREAQEEASLPEEIVRRDTKAAGTVTYFHIRDRRAGGETGLLQPECQYVYDLELAEDVVPKPGDDEVAGFELKTVEEVEQAMRNGEFKPNCALVLLDFLVRHGFVDADEPGYIEIVARLHRRFEFPTL